MARRTAAPHDATDPATVPPGAAVELDPCARLVELTRETLRVLATAHDRGEHGARVLGESFVVLPGVFSPACFADTALFAAALVQRVPAGTSFLEVGPGSGAISITLARHGVRVTAVDINPQAVENTRRNARRHGVEVGAHESDVYDGLDPDRRFGAIFWNVPFAPCHPEDRDPTVPERAVIDPGYAAIGRFLAGARARLAPGGTVYLGFSDTLGDPAALGQLIRRHGLQVVERCAWPCHEGSAAVTMDLYVLRPAEA